MAKKGIYIEKEAVSNQIRKICSEEWSGEVEVSDLYERGNTNRVDIRVDGKEASLNFYFKNDGSTTIQVTGKNTDISNRIKDSLESKAQYKATVDNRTSSFKGLSEDYIDELICYLSENDKVTYNEADMEDIPGHRKYVFKSAYGDKMVINRYGNGTILLQGKPAYIYSETLAFLSYSNYVTSNDLIASVTSINNVEVEPDDVNDELKNIIGDKFQYLDENVRKILSPAISLRKISIGLEDYSCFAFPALRALEGQIKWMLIKKGVSLGENFGTIFNGVTIYPGVQQKINDSNYSQKLQDLYVYYKNNRHIYFHTDNVLEATNFLENRAEAELIISNVISLIQSSLDVAV